MDQSLEHKRHTLAHLLAAATLELYPDAKLTLGPAIDTGFYYDIDFGEEKIGDADLKKIQKGMKKMLNKWTEFTHREVSADEAREIYKDNPYKIELINEIDARGETITLYTIGGFTDLCRGGHSEKPSQEISADAFKLDRVAGAYWRGDENNTMLTRIYGIAFDTAEELEKYETMMEEAKKRDHRKLGKELDLFTFSDLVGPGLPLFTPRGALMRNLLDGFVWELRQKHGYQQVDIPHITKKDLFETSGHWDKFADELFRINTREGHEFAMKPMNCPFHTQIFDRKPHSYREMPQRYANTTKVYRDEQTGELSGLSRVRSITQDDAHVFCRESQFIDEALNVWNIIEEFYKRTGFGELKVRLSLRDPEHPEKYKGDSETWEKSEAQLRELINKKGADFFEGLGEAAFYGPKIDFMSYDSLGREWQVATIQADRSMPESFDLSCVNESGEPERVVMIHAAIMGSIERFMSVLIEHHNGHFPVWLAPVQATIVPVSVEGHGDYAEKIFKELKNSGVRVEYDNSTDSLGKKIKKSKTMKVPYTIVLGDKEKDSETLTVEMKNDEKLEGVTVDSLIERIQHS